MDWLTADLVFKSIATVIGLWILCWICGSALFWCCCDEGRRDLRMKWRVWQERKRQERARQIQAEWNPRSTAMRGEFGSARGHDGHFDRQPYRVNGHNSSTAGASDQRRDPRLLTGSFGG